jgi:hypothetical protein
MKKALLFLILFPSILQAQEPWTFPPRVTVAGEAPSLPNAKRNFEKDPDAYFSSYIQNFHPIGWSADGKAAFLLWGESEFMSRFSVIIYDAASDTVAAEWHNHFELGEWLSPEQAELLWKRSADSILPLLKRFRIIPSGAIYNDFPFHYNTAAGERYFSVSSSIHVSPYDERFHDSISISCITRNGNRIDSLRIGKGDYYALSISPAGLWMSPDRKFALVIISAEHGGQHGDERPHSIYYSVKTLALPEE